MSDFFAPNREALSSRTNIFFLIIALLTLLWPIIGPDIFTEHWGFDQFAFLPDFALYVYIALAVVIFGVMFITPERHSISILFEKWFWGERKNIGRPITIVLAVVFFLVFRYSAHLYGEGYLNISNFAQRMSPVIPWYEYGSTVIPYLIYKALTLVGVDNIPSSIWSYTILSLASGGIFIYTTFKTADFVSQKNDDKIAFLFMLWFSGILLTFFGFIEKSPLVLAVGAVFLHYLIIAAKNPSKKQTAILAAIAVFGLFLDLFFISVIPVVGYIILRSIIKRRNVGTFAGTIAAYILMLAGIVILYSVSVGNLFLENHILLLSKLDKKDQVEYSARLVQDQV